MAMPRGAIGVGPTAMLRRFIVEGESMMPTYVPGDRLLVLRIGRRPRIGDVVVVVDPRTFGTDAEREIVKRVTDQFADGSLEVAGDNLQASTDSRTFGPVPKSHVRGRVLRRY